MKGDYIMRMRFKGEKDDLVLLRTHITEMVSDEGSVRVFNGSIQKDDGKDTPHH